MSVQKLMFDFIPNMKHFITFFICATLLTPSSLGLQCHICKSNHKDGIISGNFCIELETLREDSASTTLQHCNVLEDARNADQLGILISAKPQTEFELTCEKLMISAGSGGYLERNCIVVEKSLANECPMPNGEQLTAAKRIALRLGVSPEETNNVEIKICYCNDKDDGCNSANKGGHSSVLFLISLILQQILG